MNTRYQNYLIPLVFLNVDIPILLWLCVQTCLWKLDFMYYMLPSIILGYLFLFRYNFNVP